MEIQTSNSPRYFVHVVLAWWKHILKKLKRLPQEFRRSLLRKFKPDRTVMKNQLRDIFLMFSNRDSCCRNHSKLGLSNRILVGADKSRLSRHNGFANFTKPVVKAVFSDCMQLAISPGRKTTGLLVQDDLLPLLNAVLRFDLLDLIQGNTSPKTKRLVFYVFYVAFFMFLTNTLSHMGG